MVLSVHTGACFTDPAGHGGGLVRALLGDTEGAIEDFEFFIQRVRNPNRRARRQDWMDPLRAGENPFTPELLAELRG